MHDTIIIGAGPAALSAAIYTARASLKTLVVGKPEESALYKTPIIGNMFGFPEDVAGAHVMEQSIKQCERFGVVFEKQYATAVVPITAAPVTQNASHHPLPAAAGNGFTVKLEDAQELTTKTVIIAPGLSYIPGRLKNEKDLAGRGVHYCAVCDGYFYKNKKVAVVGHGNYAAEEALVLHQYTKYITIYSRGKGFAFTPEMHALIERAGIALSDKKVDTVVGGKKCEGIEVSEEGVVPVDGVFIAIGHATALAFANTLGLQMNGQFIVVDEQRRTNVPGVFAAGNVTGSTRQAAVAVGEGCDAAISAIKYLKGQEVYIDYH